MNNGRLPLFATHIGVELTARIGVLRARDQSGFEIFDDCEMQLIQGLAPEYDTLLRSGYNVKPQIDDDFCDFELTLVQITRSKVETQMLVAQAWNATRVGGRIVVDGQKTDGIESIFKYIRKLGIEPDGLVKAHGRLFWFDRTDANPFTAWLTPKLASPAGFTTAPGIFSAEKIDKGSQVLLENLPVLAGQGADFGAGWGYLSRAVLQSDQVEKLTLYEAEIAALNAAKQNISDVRAAFEWTDLRGLSGQKFDFIVTNPPFHTERAANTDLGVAFLTAAARNLKPKGQFFCVANRHLPYEAALDELFRSVTEIGGTSAFKVFQASQPRRL